MMSYHNPFVIIVHNNAMQSFVDDIARTECDYWDHSTATVVDVIIPEGAIA